MLRNIMRGEGLWLWNMCLEFEPGYYFNYLYLFIKIRFSSAFYVKAYVSILD